MEKVFFKRKPTLQLIIEVKVWRERTTYSKSSVFKFCLWPRTSQLMEITTYCQFWKPGLGLVLSLVPVLSTEPFAVPERLAERREPETLLADSHPLVPFRAVILPQGAFGESFGCHN